ncbi:hypothetical protein CB1_001003002 [Camelus ferus]|nr:hypothetical protein CB1_001003002 [Camelus ferus]
MPGNGLSPLFGGLALRSKALDLPCRSPPGHGGHEADVKTTPEHACDKTQQIHHGVKVFHDGSVCHRSRTRPSEFSFCLVFDRVTLQPMGKAKEIKLKLGILLQKPESAVDLVIPYNSEKPEKPARPQSFKSFLKSEFSEENLEFWLACEDYKKIKSPVKMAEKAKKIYEEFIQTEAPNEVLYTFEIPPFDIYSFGYGLLITDLF